MNSSNYISGFSLSIKEMRNYLEGNYVGEELVRVETLIRENPVYQAAIKELEIELRSEKNEFEKLLQLEKSLDQEVDLIAKEIHIDSKDKNQVWETKKRQFLGYKIAARVVLIFALGYVVYMGLRPAKEIRLAYSYLSHFEDPLFQLGKLEDQAILFYQQHNYKEAIPLLEMLVKENSNLGQTKQNRFRMFLGVSLLHEKRIDESVSHFQEIIKHNDNIYVMPAHWYLSLASLVKMDQKSARYWLSALLKSPRQDRTTEFYKQKAKALLNDMDIEEGI